jgi:hypothetical protein
MQYLGKFSIQDALIGAMTIDLNPTSLMHLNFWVLSLRVAIKRILLPFMARPQDRKKG